jgi:hypothetical protein
MRLVFLVIGIFAMLTKCFGQPSSNVARIWATIHSNDLAFLNTNNPNYLTNIGAAYAAYRQGKVSKGAMMLLMQRAANAQPQDFYGSIIAQHGQPVSRVTVTGNLMVMGGLGDGAKNQTLTTQSDTNGLFQFTDIKGWRFGITVKKVGYAMSLRKGPNGKTTSPNDREIFTMWKLQGAEPLISFNFKTYVPIDGTPVEFNLQTGQQVQSGGDLTISLQSTNAPSVRKEYDWQTSVQITGGGIIQDSNGFGLQKMFQAPDSGYEPEFDLSFQKNTQTWTPRFNADFYFYTQGNKYGKLWLEIDTDVIKNDAAFVTLKGYLNPSGSHDLEIDPAKVTEAKP